MATANDCTIVVSNISPKLQDKHLEDLFAACGTVKKFEMSPADAQGLRTCTIEFGEASSAAAAAFLNGTELGDRKLVVTLPSAAPPTPSPAVATPAPAPTPIAAASSPAVVNPVAYTLLAALSAATPTPQAAAALSVINSVPPRRQPGVLTLHERLKPIRTVRELKCATFLCDTHLARSLTHTKSREQKRKIGNTTYCCPRPIGRKLLSFTATTRHRSTDKQITGHHKTASS